MRRALAKMQYLLSAGVIAVPGNPLDDISLMKKVDFVMKEGVVYKQGGKPTDASFDSSLGM